ncbi:toxin glutamine deamidase domain-containing protein [Gryllotalpicola reticulitermitis]|uniref:Toxin glutamine deamidase domain-containing protein n=1 Tax=Gryllotalpicola reticulitermitis TaxID=1184153 RepID=A0ABV8QAQ8_9MICO
MSDLQNLIRTLEAVNQDADRLAAQLAQQAGRLNHAAGSAAAATQGSGRPEGTQAAAALQHANKALTQAAQLLHASAVAGKGFVARHAASSGGAKGDFGPHSSPEFGPGANLEPRPPWATPARYLAPTVGQQTAFTNAVRGAGAHNVAGWVQSGNPNWGTSEAWNMNCGPCSRSFADAYQGLGTTAAYGDNTGLGEEAEMWAALGVGQPLMLDNSSHLLPPAAFSSAAYGLLGDKLALEPPGTVAIVGVDWDVPGLGPGASGGHWFNGYVDDSGAVCWADEQSGKYGGWPPSYSSDICSMEAFVREPGTPVWRELKL